MPSLPPYIIYLLAVLISGIISVYTVRKTIFITKKMKIYDVPDKIRKIHGDGIPSLGGIGVFTGYVLVAVFFWPQHHYYMPALLASSVLLFFTGIYDDLVNMRPAKKLIAQVAATFITAYFAGITVGPCFAALGFGQMPYVADIAITLLCGAFFINVFNFIDGIDGLACVLALFYLSTLGILFVCTGHGSAAGIAFALTGATAGLLWFNIAPAKIYMGDTGSMFLGAIIFNFSLLFIKWCSIGEVNMPSAHIHGMTQAAILAAALLFMPVYDGVRVFIIRLSKGISPLKADRSHLHYYLLDAGFTHSQSVAIIAGTNILVVITAWQLQDMHPAIVLLCITAITSVVVFIIYRLRQRQLSAHR